MILFQDLFVGNNLITNEYAHWNPTDPKAVKSANWDMTSGSLFRNNNRAYSGVPDNKAPDPQSLNGNNSCVFRLNTKRFDFQNVAVSFLLNVKKFVTSSSTPAVDWDGIHIFLRYQDETSLYYASVCRRDGKVLIKKKIPGGPSNGGTYYTISQEVSKPFTINADARVKATIVNQPDGSVKIQLFSKGVLLLEAIDKGEHGAPITKGATGIRGDNAEFEFDEFTVEQV